MGFMPLAYPLLVLFNVGYDSLKRQVITITHCVRNNR
jgi:hypothetical protein